MKWQSKVYKVFASQANMKPTEQGPFKDLRIGVLELQGDFAEHTDMLRRSGAGRVVGIRLAEDLHDLDALVIPGGESTVMSKLLVEQQMMDKVKTLAKQGLPMFGTCAGCIMLANDIRQRPEQPRIGALNVSVDRNAYGSQIDSFETMVKSAYKTFVDGPPLRVVHIRAPAIVKVGEGVEVLAKHHDRPILVRQDGLLACTFHPELTNDARVHQLFLEMVQERKNNLA